MLEQSFLEALQSAFWPVWFLAIGCAGLRFAVQRQWCIGRTTAALALGMLAQFLWEAGGFLQPWQHMAIDISIFICVTMPPRHYWQSAIAGLVMAQIWLHAIWWLSPDLARTHWLGGTILEFAKCAVLLLWSGGARVETVLHSAARFVADMVPVSLSAKPAR